MSLPLDIKSETEPVFKINLIIQSHSAALFMKIAFLTKENILWGSVLVIGYLIVIYR